MAEPQKYKCKVRPGAKITFGERRLAAGEYIELTDAEIAVNKDLLELPEGYVPHLAPAFGDYVDPLTGQANRLGPAGLIQTPEQEATRGLRDTQEKAKMEEQVRDKAAADLRDKTPAPSTPRR